MKDTTRITKEQLEEHYSAYKKQYKLSYDRVKKRKARWINIEKMMMKKQKVIKKKLMLITKAPKIKNFEINPYWRKDWWFESVVKWTVYWPKWDRMWTNT